MSFGVMLAVLAAAFLNAAWNTSVKALPDKFVAISLICFGSAIVSLPFALVLPPIAPAAYPYLALSAALQVCYYLLINRAYHTADLSLAYPMMRGAAPVLTTLFAFLLFGEAPKISSLLGIGFVLAGVFWLARNGFKMGGLDRRTIQAVAMNSVVIAGYSMADGQGGRLSGQPVAYSLWLMVIAGVAFLPVAWFYRRRSMLVAARRYWHFGLIGGGAAMVAYAIVVWAMSQAPIGLVSALRETSALFAAVLAAVFLGEKFGPARYVAAALVVCGLALLRLA